MGGHQQEIGSGVLVLALRRRPRTFRITESAPNPRCSINQPLSNSLLPLSHIHKRFCHVDKGRGSVRLLILV